MQIQEVAKATLAVQVLDIVSGGAVKSPRYLADGLQMVVENFTIVNKIFVHLNMCLVNKKMVCINMFIWL